MSTSIALDALLILFIAFALAALFASRSIANGKPLSSFLLAGHNLKRSGVVNLLWSSSFSLNGMLYQMYLGYMIGGYALITQAAWAFSFYLLARFAPRITAVNSLHEAMGNQYGKSFRIFGAILSLIGAMALIGWEYNVGTLTFSGLLSPSEDGHTHTGLVMFGAIGLCVLYTMTGGIKGNAVADLLQAVLKMFGFAGITILMLSSLPWASSSFWERIFPELSKIGSSIGWLGLGVNVLFSLVWQFVDMSTWQATISGKSGKSEEQISSELRRGGLWTFIAPGVIGTVMGIILQTTPDVTDGNVLAMSLSGVALDNPLFGVLVAITLIACIMSMIDGALMASAYALILDLFKSGRSIEDLDGDRVAASRLISWVRLSFPVLALLGSLGVTYLMDKTGLGAFGIVYMVTLPPLILTGPVLAYVFNRQSKHRHRFPTALICGTFVAILSVWLGRASGLLWIVEASGVFAMVASIGLTWLLTKPNTTV